MNISENEFTLEDLPHDTVLTAIDTFLTENNITISELNRECVILQLAGRELLHEHIMASVPFCSMDDVVLLERGDNVKFKISTTAMMKSLLTRMKLGKSGIAELYNAYLAHRKTKPNATPEFSMAAVARSHGVQTKDAQVIITQILRVNNLLKEESMPVANTAGTMPDHKATDGPRPMKKKKKSLKDCREVNQHYIIDET